MEEKQLVAIIAGILLTRTAPLPASPNERPSREIHEDLLKTAINDARRLITMAR